MNLISALLGIFLIGFLGLIVIFPFRATFGVGAWLATFLVAVMANACVESLVVSKWFKTSFAQKDFGFIVAANFLTVGIAYAGLRFFPIAG